MSWGCFFKQTGQFRSSSSFNDNVIYTLINWHGCLVRCIDIFSTLKLKYCGVSLKITNHSLSPSISHLSTVFSKSFVTWLSCVSVSVCSSKKWWGRTLAFRKLFPTYSLSTRFIWGGLNYRKITSHHIVCFTIRYMNYTHI